MKNKSLIPLIAVLAVLVVLIVVKVSMTRQPTIVEQVQLTPLVPEGLAKPDVAKVELFAGAKPEEKVVLARDADDPDTWRVATHFNAPADLEKIEGFVDEVADMKGEFRATVEGDEALKEYNLTDDLAFHIKGFKKDGDAPAFEVLIGKAPAASQVLVRAAGSNDVYVLDANLRREAGVWEDEADAVPEADAWLGKDVLNVAKDELAKVEVSSPDKHLVFERREKEQPEAEEKAEGEESAGEPAEEPEADEPKQYEWIVAEGGPGIPHRQTGLDSLLGSFDPLTATTIVDPAKKAEWGLEPAQFTLTLTLAGQEEPVVLKGGRPDASGDGYVQVAGSDDDVVYKLSKWQFERVFPKGKDLFALPGLTVNKDEIDRIEIEQPEGRVVLAKNEDEWAIEEPKADLEVQTHTLTTIASTLAAWAPGDYADSTAGAKLDSPTRRVTFTAGPDVKHTIALGADSRDIDGAYAKLDDSETVAVMVRGDIDRVFVSPGQLYEHTILDADEQDLREIDFVGKAESFDLKHGEAGWIMHADGADIEPDEEAVENLARAIVDLQASDILFGETGLGGGALATITLTMQDGAKETLSISEEEDGVHQVMASDKPVSFTVDALDIAAVLPTSESLKKAEPEPEPEAAPAEGEEQGMAETPAEDATEAPAGKAETPAEAAQ